MKTNTLESQSMVTDADVMAVARTAFQHARAGNSANLAWLIGSGLPVNLANEKGEHAVDARELPRPRGRTRTLLEHGADPERTNDRGQTPLAGAAFKGDLTLARLLLDHGARVDGAGPDGKTALMFAAMFDRLEVLERCSRAARRPSTPTPTSVPRSTTPGPWGHAAPRTGSRSRGSRSCTRRACSGEPDKPSHRPPSTSHGGHSFTTPLDKKKMLTRTLQRVSFSFATTTTTTTATNIGGSGLVRVVS